MFYIGLIILLITCGDIAVKNPSLNKRGDSKWNICLLSVLVYMFLIIFGQSTFHTAIVDTSQGSLVGIYSYNYDYKMYLGIPYAEKPNRFKAPKPLKKWDNVFEANDEGDSCAQIAITNIYSGTEDCLFLNIYTPKYSKKDSKLPVMVFFHGGAYQFGSGDRLLYSPDFLVRHNVIVVTVNYRLGALGFLCLGIEGAPGNAGLKDQLAALKWVSQNIASLGGDEDNVTIFGESAGAASVAYHILSSKSAGLFQKAIMQSGSALAPWSFVFDPVTRAGAAIHDPNVNKSDLNDVLEYYNKASTYELTKLQSKAEVYFKPCAERNIERYDPFLTDSPISILKSGNFTKVSLIVGFNDAEGLFFQATKSYDSLLKPEFTNIDFESDSDREKIMKKVEEIYQIGVSDEGTTNYYSDVLVNAPLIKFISEILNQTNERMYNYYFKYVGTRNIAKFTSRPFSKGAAHGDELFYLFNMRFFSWKPNARDQLMIDRMTELWTSFAKFGDPTPPVLRAKSLVPIEWLPSNRTNLNFLEMDDVVKIGELPTKEHFAFWNKVYEEFGIKS